MTRVDQAFAAAKAQTQHWQDAATAAPLGTPERLHATLRYFSYLKALRRLAAAFPFRG